LKLTGEILARTAWFIDYDGSVCPHQEVWEERVYDPATIQGFVSRLAQKAGGVFWNTGRRPESLGSVHSQFLDQSGYFIHGSFYWDAEKRESVQLGTSLPPGVGDRFAALMSGYPELRLEIKPTGLRVAPLQLSQLPRARHFAQATRDLVPVGFAWQSSHRGNELLPLGFDKAFAVEREMAKMPLDTIPLAIGDDLMDRPAFVAALERDGFVIPVGDACGWVTELKHTPDQVIYCEDPSRVQELIESLLVASP